MASNVSRASGIALLVLLASVHSPRRRPSSVASAARSATPPASCQASRSHSPTKARVRRGPRPPTTPVSTHSPTFCRAPTRSRPRSRLTSSSNTVVSSLPHSRSWLWTWCWRSGRSRSSDRHGRDATRRSCQCVRRGAHRPATLDNLPSSGRNPFLFSTTVPNVVPSGIPPSPGCRIRTIRHSFRLPEPSARQHIPARWRADHGPCESPRDHPIG